MRNQAPFLLFLCTLFMLGQNSATVAQGDTLFLPQLESAPTIDGQLDEWKSLAHHDGLWDIFRLQASPWYDASRNRLTDHGEHASLVGDLSARYYTAWDKDYLYLGAEVWDNRNDTIPSKPGAHRWYYKDAIAWFIEAPGDENNEAFGQGDNAFCFTADPTNPPNGAWWRHGTPDTTFIEEPIPENSVDYVIRMNPWDRSEGDYILEARIHLASTMMVSDPSWKAPEIGHLYRMMIVHCDPDGGAYGGHFLIYGEGDADQSWTSVRLIGPKGTPQRKVK